MMFVSLSRVWVWVWGSREDALAAVASNTLYYYYVSATVFFVA